MSEEMCWLTNALPERTAHGREDAANVALIMHMPVDMHWYA